MPEDSKTTPDAAPAGKPETPAAGATPTAGPAPATPVDPEKAKAAAAAKAKAAAARAKPPPPPAVTPPRAGGVGSGSVPAFPSGESEFAEQPALAGGKDFGHWVLQATLWALLLVCGWFVVLGCAQIIRLFGTYYG